MAIPFKVTRIYLLAALLVILGANQGKASTFFKRTSKVDLVSVRKSFPLPAETVRPRLIETMEALGFSIHEDSPNAVIALVPPNKVPGVTFSGTPPARTRYYLKAKFLDHAADHTRIGLSFYATPMRLPPKQDNIVKYHSSMLFSAFWKEAKEHGLHRKARPNPPTLKIQTEMSWRSPALRAGVQREGKDSIGRLSLQLSIGDTRRREKAAKALGRSNNGRAVDPLIEALNDPSLRVRASAAEGLGKLGNSRGLEPLIGLLTDESPLLRAIAARSLGKIGGNRAANTLQALLLLEKDKRVRKAARKALRRLD